MSLTRISAALALMLGAGVSMAAEPDQAIRQALQSLDANLPIEAIAESPMSGIYQVQLEGGRQLYTSADGQFLIQGYLFQVKDGKAVNLTEIEESRAVAKQINAIPAKEMVVFAPKAPKTHITVFTDTDCGYCQKLHSEVPSLCLSQQHSHLHRSESTLSQCHCVQTDLRREVLWSCSRCDHSRPHHSEATVSQCQCVHASDDQEKSRTSRCDRFSVWQYLVFSWKELFSRRRRTSRSERYFETFVKNRTWVFEARNFTPEFDREGVRITHIFITCSYPQKRMA